MFDSKLELKNLFMWEKSNYFFETNVIIVKYPLDIGFNDIKFRLR